LSKNFLVQKAAQRIENTKMNTLYNTLRDQFQFIRYNAKSGNRILGSKFTFHENALLHCGLVTLSVSGALWLRRGRPSINMAQIGKICAASALGGVALATITERDSNEKQ